MITTTTKHTITVQYSDMKSSFYSSQLDMIKDELHGEDNKTFEHGIKNLHADIVTIENEGFGSLFRDGYTMVLLPGKDFDFVDEWFGDNKHLSEELVVVIMKGEKVVEEVRHTDLCY